MIAKVMRYQSLRALACILVLLPPLLGSCARRQATEDRPPTAVRATRVERRDFVLEVSAPARLVAEREVNIVPKVGGRVARVGAVLGQEVAAGQVLLSLDSKDYDSQYRQAQAGLQSADAALTRTSDAGQGQQLIQAQGAFDAAQVAYDDAKGLYDKTRRLYEGGAIARQQFDGVEARFKAAGIQLESSRQSLALLKDKGGPQATDIASGQRDQARAQADLAKSQLEAATVTSPLSGKVSYRNVEVGELVGPASLVFIVIDDSRVIAEAGLSERLVGRLMPGQVLGLTVDAFPAGSPPLLGRVESVSPAADPRTMLYPVRVALDNPRGALRSGMLARLRIPVETRPGALLVPERTVFSSGGGDAVYVVSGGLARLRPIVLGESDGTSVEVRSGLSEGEVVVTEGQEFLSDGEGVRTVD